MNRVKSIEPEHAPKNIQEIYQTIEKTMGRVPNIFLNMGNSAAVLKGYLNLNEALNQTSLSPKIREKIALTVGQANQCNYCLSAHTAIGHNTGMTDQEILQARKAQSQDPKTQAILTFAKLVVDKKGNVADQDVKNLKSAGVSDTELVEIILTINLSMFTNYFNHITNPKIDFPQAAQMN